VRITVFCPGWGAVGGIERKAAALVAEIQRRGHEVVVLARGDQREPRAVPPVFRRRFHAVPQRRTTLVRRLRFALRWRPAVADLRYAARAAGADVVLSLTVSAFAPYAAALARVAPLVYSVEGREAGGVFTPSPRALRAALGRATCVIACSRSLEADVRALAPEVASRLVTVPNGVEAGVFGAGPAFAHPRPYVLALGRLARQKGFDLLLDAFARAELAGRELDLVIAGDGPERSALELARARLGLVGRVHLLGAVDEPTAAALYRGALVVACPSRWEGLPLVCLEAMASGRPVVAAAVDGIPDAVVHDESGLLVPPEDPPALALALEALLIDAPRRRRLGEHACAVARTRFAWSQVAGRYLEVLAAAAGGS
jgi:glycogen(starch) synthase